MGKNSQTNPPKTGADFDPANFFFDGEKEGGWEQKPSVCESCFKTSWYFSTNKKLT